LREDGDEADARDRDGEADAERDDEQQPERDPVQRDRGEQDDERRRAGQQAAGDPDGEQTAAVVVVVMVVVVVPVCVRAGAASARPVRSAGGASRVGASRAAADVTWSGLASRSRGYARSSSEVERVCAPKTISRQPMRPAHVRSTTTTRTPRATRGPRRIAW